MLSVVSSHFPSFLVCFEAWSHSIALAGLEQAGLEHAVSLVSACQVLALQACTTMPSQILRFPV